MASWVYPVTVIMLLSIALIASLWRARHQRAQQQPTQPPARVATEGVTPTQFLAGLHHELRQPLYYLCDRLDRLAICNAAEQRQLLDQARHAADDVLANLADIFTFLRLDHESSHGDTQPCAVNATIGVVADSLALRLTRHNNRLEQTLDPTLEQAVGVDAHTLRQIIFYLLHNAAQATFNGFIKIHSRRTQRHDANHDCFISVEHSGLDYTNTTIAADGLPAGSALSFALCQQLVRRIGGVLSIAPREQRLPGLLIQLRFTARTIAIPQPPPITHLENVITMPRSLKNNFRVLVAEDNPVNQALMRAYLQKQGHQVTIAADGAEAIKHLSAQLYDFVLMDIQMPVMDGLAATDFIRRSGTAWAQIPIIAVTANTMDLDASCYQSLGLDDLVTKPVDFAYLEKIITKVMAEKGKMAGRVALDDVKQAL